MLVKGSGHYCQYKKCPSLDTKKQRVRPYKTIYRCEECSMETGECVWHCNTTKKIDGWKPSISLLSFYEVSFGLKKYIWKLPVVPNVV